MGDETEYNILVGRKW